MHLAQPHQLEKRRGAMGLIRQILREMSNEDIGVDELWRRVT